ncbi:unnamed protein product [Brassica oleracea]
MRMFGNTVDAMADGARGVMKGAAGQRRLLVLVVLVMIFIRWNTILVPQYEFIALGADTNVGQSQSNVGLSVIFVKSSFVNIIELLTSHLNLFNIFLGASIIGNNNGRRFVFSRQFNQINYMLREQTCIPKKKNSCLELSQAAGQPRLLVPVVLVMIFNRWNALIVPEYWIHALEVETNVGWVLYLQYCYILSSYRRSHLRFYSKNRCLKAPVSVYINKLDCCVLRGQSD